MSISCAILYINIGKGLGVTDFRIFVTILTLHINFKHYQNFMRSMFEFMI